MPKIAGTSEVTELVYSRDIGSLLEVVSDYLVAARKEDVWLLFDNLDKGWPVLSVRPEDVLILKSLLDATRKLQRQFEKKEIELRAVVFIRNDIYQHLVLDPADRGKETPVILDWNDPAVFKEILRRRIIQSTGLDYPFEQLWPTFFDMHFKGEESFSYILSRTLMRPREVISFARECVDAAVNRGHDRVSEEDVMQAERTFSDDALVDISHELGDVNPALADLPYAFIGSKVFLSKVDVLAFLETAKVPKEARDKALDLLLWFGFLGVLVSGEEERYSYQFQHDAKKMQSGVKDSAYCIHPAFRRALGCSDV